MKLAFIDCETTGLEPDRHEVWEIAVAQAELDVCTDCAVPRRELRVAPIQRFHVEHDPATASADALRLTHYYERAMAVDAHGTWQPRGQVAEAVAILTAERHLVGMCPWFDAAFLDRLLRREHRAPAWHYHLIDLEAIAVGRLGWIDAWKSDDLSRELDVDPTLYSRHSAQGDVEWAVDFYCAALNAIPVHNGAGVANA